MTQQVITPVARLVQGSATRAITHNRKTGEPYVYKSGPNKGKPSAQYFVALAIDKRNPEWDAFKARFVAEARTGYPNLIKPDGTSQHPRFAWKIADGDSVDDDGKSNAEKPGWAGHWIVKCSTYMQPKVVHNGQYVTDDTAIKTGYFVRAVLSIKPNTGSEIPGLYVSQQAIELVGYGEEIVSGLDAVAAFATPAATGWVPQGMTSVPTVAPASNLAFVANAIGKPMLTPTPLANGVPYAQYIDNGWTDNQLIAMGYFTL